MPLEKILFFNESVSFTLRNKTLIRKWINRCAKHYGFKIDSLSFIFCSDKYLLKLNKKYLSHNYFTDVITFDNRSLLEKTPTRASHLRIIYADIFISIDSVKKNAAHYKQAFSKELKRVMIHGVLHLMGLDDKTEMEKKRMKKAEERWLKPNLLNKFV